MFFVLVEESIVKVNLVFEKYIEFDHIQMNQDKVANREIILP